MMDAETLVYYVIDNWKKITGTSKRTMYDEQEFPDEVLALLDKHGVDYFDFLKVWTTNRG